MEHQFLQKFPRQRGQKEDINPLKTLPESIEDAKEIRKTFNYWNYKIHDLKNPTNAKIK